MSQVEVNENASATMSAMLPPQNSSRMRCTHEALSPSFMVVPHPLQCLRAPLHKACLDTTHQRVVPRKQVPPIERIDISQYVTRAILCKQM